MATAVILQFPGGNLDQYDAVMDAAEMRDQPASSIPGLKVHAVYPTDGGFAIFDLWDSLDAFNAHFANRIGPAMQKVGFAIQPEMQTYDIHNAML